MLKHHSPAGSGTEQGCSVSERALKEAPLQSRGPAKPSEPGAHPAAGVLLSRHTCKVQGSSLCPLIRGTCQFVQVHTWNLATHRQARSCLPHTQPKAFSSCTGKSRAGGSPAPSSHRVPCPLLLSGAPVLATSQQTSHTPVGEKLHAGLHTLQLPIPRASPSPLQPPA